MCSLLLRTWDACRYLHFVAYKAPYTIHTRKNTEYKNNDDINLDIKTHLLQRSGQ